MIEASELFVDQKLVRLRPINIMFVSRYRQAYRAGAKMPPLVIERGTNRIVSGNHRIQAILEEFGAGKKVECIVKQFRNEKAVLKFFAEENAHHGNALDSISKKRLTMALMDQGASEKEIARIFDVSVKRVIKWMGKNIIVIGKEGKKYTAPWKRGPEIQDMEVKEEVYREHETHDRGVSIRTLVNQLIRWFDNDWIGRNEKNIELLEMLQERISIFILML